MTLYPDTPAGQPLVLFFHGNSFPASTYSVMLDALRQRGMKVQALEKIGHNPAYPVTSNWPHIAKELALFAAAEVQKAGEPAFLVGHSLGGFLSLMTSCKHPELSRGVVLLDSPILGGWRAKTLQFAKVTQLVGSISPGKISQNRRYSWDSDHAALAHFASKKMFAKWHPQMLQDYITYCTHDDVKTGKRVLSFDRAIECCPARAFVDRQGTQSKLTCLRHWGQSTQRIRLPADQNLHLAAL